MCFFLGEKFNGSIFYDIRGQHEVLKVRFMVIRVSKTVLGAERCTFLTYRGYINTFWNTLHLDHVMPLLLSIHNIALHVRDTMNVRVKHPALYRQFADGFFTIAKTQNPLSLVHLFQNTLRPQKNCSRISLNGFVFSNYLKTTYTKSAKIESAIAA